MKTWSRSWPRYTKRSSTSPYGFIATRLGQQSLLLNVITPRLFN